MKAATKFLSALLALGALAISLPAAAFAQSSKPLSYQYTYELLFDGYDAMSLSPGDTGTLTAPALPEGAVYWLSNTTHVQPGDTFTYDSLDDWLCPGVDFDANKTTGAYFVPVYDRNGVTVHYINAGTAITETVPVGGTTTVPTEIDGRAVAYWQTKDGSVRVCTPNTLTYDDFFWRMDVQRSMIELYAVYADEADTGTAAETPANSTVTAPAQAAPQQTGEPAAPVDTRTDQEKEIDEAKANGTWGIEYTTCQKCGYHNWTRQGNVYVCDTCGNTTDTVVSAKGVKGYVDSTAAAPAPQYATAQEAQAAADKREADYAAAVEAYRKQSAAGEAAYLASLKR